MLSLMLSQFRSTFSNVQFAQNLLPALERSLSRRGFRIVPVAATEECQSTGSCYPTDDNEAGVAGGGGSTSSNDTSNPVPFSVLRSAARALSLSRRSFRIVPVAATEECQSTGSCYPTDDNEAGVTGGGGDTSSNDTSNPVPFSALRSAARTLGNLPKSLIGAGSSPLLVAEPAAA